jgi:hypothetical protein
LAPGGLVDRRPALWDACAVADAEARFPFGGLGGRGGAGARREARRIAEELVERGHLSRAEAEALERAVADAAEASRRLLEEEVFAPALRGLAAAARAVADALAAARPPERR